MGEWERQSAVARLSVAAATADDIDVDRPACEMQLVDDVALQQLVPDATAAACRR